MGPRFIATVAWSVAIGITGPLAACAEDGAPSPEQRIALLPAINLTGQPAATRPILDRLRFHLEQRGITLVAAEDLERYMQQRRIRDTSGVTAEMGASLLDEAGGTAFLVTSIEDSAIDPAPRFTVTLRLVSAEPEPRVLWVDTATHVGYEAPGWFNLGIVTDLAPLRDRSLEELAESLARYRLGQSIPPAERVARRHRPKVSFSAPFPARPEGQPLRIAVLPFANDTGRGGAAEIVTQQIVRFLAASVRVQVLEPGLVREALLKGRIIQKGSASYPQGDFLKSLLDVDLVVAGRVLGYQDPIASSARPYVYFSLEALDPENDKVVWVSTSSNRGDDGVFFYELGSLYSTGALVAEMARACVEEFLSPLAVAAGQD